MEAATSFKQLLGDPPQDCLIEYKTVLEGEKGDWNESKAFEVHERLHSQPHQIEKASLEEFKKPRSQNLAPGL